MIEGESIDAVVEPEYASSIRKTLRNITFGCYAAALVLTGTAMYTENAEPIIFAGLAGAAATAARKEYHNAEYTFTRSR
jgi:hypothetical protein